MAKSKKKSVEQVKPPVEVLPTMDKVKIEAIGKIYNELSEVERTEFIKNLGFNLDLYNKITSFSSAVYLGIYNGNVAWIQLKASDIESLGYIEVMKHHILTKSLPDELRVPPKKK